MEKERTNDRIIIQRDGNELKTELKRIRTQIIKLQKKWLGQKDKIAFAHYRISDLEQIFEKIQAPYDAIPPSQVIIALPTIVPPPVFDSRDFFPPEEISSPEGAETPVKSPILMSPSSSVGSSTSPPDYLFNESIFAELDNSLWIISRPLGSKPVPEEFNMLPNRTLTSAAPAMTQDAIRQLVADSVATALKA
ncbi:hypothetical protein Tco_0781077 [Tanacetum coccineum]